jgi:hypothetical protein
MATNVTLNGSTYSIPRTGDSSWSATGGVDDYMVALATGVLQKAGGAFTLSAEVDFGASFGLKALYLKSRGTTPATAGVLRLANAEALSWRNQGNSANLDLKVNASNVLEFNGNPLVTLALGTADQALKMNAGGTAYEWGKLADANIAAAAAIALSKLATVTASKALVSDASGFISASAVTSTELGYLSGVTSAVQTQINTNSTNITTNATNLATHIADAANPHAVTKTQVGLSNVDNTSDATKNAASATLTNKTISGASNTITNVSLTTGVTGTLPLANGGTGQTSASLAINALVPSQTGNANKVLTTDGSAVSWGAGGGSGAGELNVITNPSAASDTTGWTASGTCTVTRLTASSPLDPVIATALRMAAGSATNYVEYTASVPTSLRNRKLKIEWHQTAPTSGEWKVDLYNTAGSTRYSLSTDSSAVSAITAQTGKYSTTFDMDSGTSVKLRFVRVTGSGNLDVTNVIVGPGIQPQGAIAGPWQTFTPVWQKSDGTGSPTYTTNTGRYRRVGDSVEIQVYSVFSAWTSSNLAQWLQMPASLTTDTANLVKGGAIGRMYDSSATKYFSLTATPATTATFLRIDAYDNTGAAFNPGNILASSDELEIHVTVPIAEWAGSGVNLAQNDQQFCSVTSTWDASDTAATSLSYSPAGTALGGTLLADRTKRVRFTSPIQLGDQVIVELSSDQVVWVPAHGARINGTIVLPSTNSGASAFAGVYWERVSGSTTDVDVFFYRYMQISNDNSVLTAWPSTNAYWRVRKVSAGAAVGFGLADGTNSGLLPANTSMADALATKLGYKSYSHGGSYSGGLAPTITLTAGGGTLTSVPRSLFIPYQVQDGSWRMRFNIYVVVSSAARTQAQLTVAGVTFKNITGFYQSYSVTDTNVTMYGYSLYNTGILVSQHASATTALYTMSGDLELDSKPTWAY